MEALLDNARRIFDVARSRGMETGSDGECQDFALLIRPDGALHFVMESPFSLEGAASHAGARTAYRVTRSRDGVRVQGRNAFEDCVLEERKPCLQFLRDQPLYRLASPLLTSSTAISC